MLQWLSGVTFLRKRLCAKDTHGLSALGISPPPFSSLQLDIFDYSTMTVRLKLASVWVAQTHIAVKSQWHSLQHFTPYWMFMQLQIAPILWHVIPPLLQVWCSLKPPPNYSGYTVQESAVTLQLFHSLTLCTRVCYLNYHAEKLAPLKTPENPRDEMLLESQCQLGLGERGKKASCSYLLPG